MAATKLKLRVLDGIADDSFKVYVNNNPVPVYNYNWSGDTSENWFEHLIDISALGLSGNILVNINSTADAWTNCDIYGQLAVNWAELYAEPTGNGGGACFIATAAYGTSTAAEIDVLRAFRDEVLLESTVGSQLVEWYYQTSPPVADFISENSLLKAIVREVVVDPIASVVEATESLWRN